MDCGITAVNEAQFCHEQGIDLIIVDHHIPGELVPNAVAIVNPLQVGCNYPFKSLAGVGVAFNLLIALRRALREDGQFAAGGEPDLREYLDLVAMGTIADVVPLIGQNRMYAIHGLRQISVSAKPGILALKQVAGITGDVSCGQVGFRLAPRLNAAGRIESAVPGVELLLSDNKNEAMTIATELDAANTERQAIERSIFSEAIKMLEDSEDYLIKRSIVLASETWHQGVIGIVASRMVERYHRPTLLIAITDDGMAKGSGRSIPGFHLLDALSSCATLLERFGGHQYAAGVTLAAGNIAAFAEIFEIEASKRLTEEDLLPQLCIDSEVKAGDVTAELALELKRLGPFGSGNPEPVLLMRAVKVIEQRVVGEGHLRLRLSCDRYLFNAIAFRMAGKGLQGVIDIAFFPELNEWNGKTSLQLRIKDIRPAE